MKKNLAKLGLGLAIVGAPALAFAQLNLGSGLSLTGNQFVVGSTSGPTSNATLNALFNLLNPIQPTGALDIGTIIFTVLRLLVLAAGVLALFYLIWAGIQYITAGTDEEKAKKVRGSILNTIIGIIVIILSYVIINIVANAVRTTPGIGGATSTNGSTGIVPNQ